MGWPTWIFSFWRNVLLISFLGWFSCILARRSAAAMRVCLSCSNWSVFSSSVSSSLVSSVLAVLRSCSLFLLKVREKRKRRVNESQLLWPIQQEQRTYAN
ncbi:MAG: hypothetical protein J3R72DRAFT_431483 [Linnemannia gamsii]|nr:MAG: hypothetical protein J3R72DRAFT_431483 [Linnemannia gamsii]